MVSIGTLMATDLPSGIALIRTGKYPKRCKAAICSPLTSINSVRLIKSQYSCTTDDSSLEKKLSLK